VHEARQEDDGDNAHHQPEEENDNPGYRVPANCSRSNHGPSATRTRPIYSVKKNQMLYPERTLPFAPPPTTPTPSSAGPIGPALRPLAHHTRPAITTGRRTTPARPTTTCRPTTNGRPGQDAVIVFRLGRVFAAAGVTVFLWGRYTTRTTHND
jgi:hypothetical protein